MQGGANFISLFFYDFPVLACIVEHCMDVADAGYTENTWLQYTANVLKQPSPVLPSCQTTPTSHRSRPPLYQVTPDKNTVQPVTAIKYENGHQVMPPVNDVQNGGKEMRDHAMFVNANKWIVPKREMSPCTTDSPAEVHNKFTLRVPTIPCHFPQNQTSVTSDVSSPVTPRSKTPPGPGMDQSLLRRALCASNGSAQLSEDTDGDRTPPHTPSSDASPSSNICPECGKNLRYRSSYRRHMRLHQGVYSHMCAVCHRKFTRKEHFLRHKCNRRSYLPSRSADNFTDTSLPSLVDKVLRVEYPSSVPPSPDKQNTPVSVSDSSVEGESLEEQDMAEDLSKLASVPVKNEPSFANGQSCQVPMAESRRKRTIPRKVIPPKSDSNCQFVDGLSNDDDDDDDDDDFFKLQICEETPPQPVENSPTDSGYEKYVDSKAVKKLETCWEKEEGKENKGQSLFPVSDNDSLLTDFQPPNHPFRAMTKMSMESTNKISLDTGEYAVSCFDADRPGGTNALNAFIKVVKQGNYLKLRKQAQMIGDQLCFVCPNCSKVFHRSSNFSRHMRIHRGVYSYVCPTCSRGFFRKEHFQKHKCYRRGMSHIWDRKTKIDMQIEKAGEPALPLGESSDMPMLPPGDMPVLPPGELHQPVAPPVLTRMLDDVGVSGGYGAVHEYPSPVCLSPDMPCLQANDSEGAIHECSQVVV